MIKKYSQVLNEEKILNIIASLTKENSGQSGDCGTFAIALKKKLGYGNYVAGINSALWELGDYFLGHVALDINGVLYDSSGIITEQTLKTYAELDPNGDEADLYNLSAEDCFNTEVVNLTELWGNRVEKDIIKWTNV